MVEIVVAQGSDKRFLRKISLDVLCDARFAPHFLSDAQWLADSLPHTIFVLQKFCDDAGVKIPELSMCNSIWRKFSPEAETQEEEDRSLYERAKRRWAAKSPEVLIAISYASECHCRSVDTFIRILDTSDFDLMMARCAIDGSDIRHAHPSLFNDRNLALMAMTQGGGEFFRDLSGRLHDDDAIAHAAVSSWGEALEAASDRLRCNTELVRLACSDWAGNIENASQQLFENTDTILELLKGVDHKALFYAHLPDFLKRDE